MSPETRAAVAAALRRAASLLEREARDAYDETAYGLRDAASELATWADQYERHGAFGDPGRV